MSQLRAARSITLALSLAASGAMANSWSEAETPAGGPARSIGEASAGCVRGARMLVPEGPGYLVMHLERNRYWGHPTLIEAVRSLGREIAHGLGIMHVGDLGMSRGGPMPFGHRSHQTGLDADIWFDLSPTLHFKANSDRSNVKAFSVLNSMTNGLDYALWSESHAHMLKLAANQPDVDRIFVNARIKDELCRSATGDRGWLRKIRPWYYHEDHFHMRLACPPDSPACVRQEPIPTGDGCEALDWWLSKPAEPTPDRKAPSAPKPALPADCRAVLAD